MPTTGPYTPATGQPRGVSVDISRELARRLGVPVEFVLYDAAGRVVDGLKALTMPALDRLCTD